MPKLIIMRGLPASGKSTKAKEIVEQTGNTVRLNKDLLRTMLHFDKFTNQKERLTIHAEEELAISFMLADKNVIIDDTNLNPKTLQHWKDFANTRGWKWEVVDLTDVTVEECVTRDLGREKKVGASVIWGMAMQYLSFGKGENTVICDIDGTIADTTHRLHYVKSEPRDWKGFFSEIHKDPLREEILSQVVDYTNKEDAQIVFVSGRPEDCRKETEEWLSLHVNGFSRGGIPLFMRTKGDKRDDTIIKGEIFDKYLARTNVLAVYDDRPRVIRMWRERGLNVIDVGSGVEF